MKKYKLTKYGVKNTATGSHIPNDPRNRHWCEYKEWLAKGNKPEVELTKAQLDSKKLIEEKAAAEKQLMEKMRKLAIEQMIADGEITKTKAKKYFGI